MPRSLNSKECLLVGDSINDYDAAVVNSVNYFGYNNPCVKSLGSGYIQKMKDIHSLIQNFDEQQA